MWIRKSKLFNENVRVSLRLKLALGSILTISYICIVSCVLVILGFHFLYHKPITGMVAIIMCLMICGLTVVWSGFALWHEALYVTNPLLRIIRGVQKVADGDLTVQIEPKVQFTHRRSHPKEQYPDEIDELARNFNVMVRELGAMEYMQKDFMSNITHEMKTPIAAISGFAEILLTGGLSEPDQKEYLNYLYEEVHRLSRLNDSMLQMSRLDYQNIVDKKQDVAVDEQIRYCIILLEEIWTKKETAFDLELEKVMVSSNYDLLFQVWTNLIENAIKYSNPKGQVWIKARREKEGITVEIRDEGIGIPVEQQDKIYDKFYQCDESHKRMGSGLGLSIVKRIIELLEGHIMCESEPGKGTSFKIYLPG